MHLPLLQDIVVLLVFSVLVVFLVQKVRLPSILGFLITGILIGPYAFSLIHAVEEVEVISEIGVILLLFVIGTELSIKQLIAIRKTVLIGGALQVGLTIISLLILTQFNFSWSQAVFLGFLFSLSSTAVVLKVLQDRDEISAPHGKNALAILIFQDIIVVPMMLVTPIMAGQSANLIGSIFWLFIKSGVVVLVTIFSAKYLVPRLMHAIAKTKSNELFLMTVISICFVVAYLTAQAGLSLALGAFMAGLIVSESEYSHQATSIILPFRELFTSFFFISIGMLLDLDFFFDHIGYILIILTLLFLFKSLMGTIAVTVLKYPPRTAILTGLSLFQIGEFAFILSKVGVEYRLLDETMNQYFLAASIISMMLTPFVMMYADKIASRLMRLKPIRNYKDLKPSDAGTHQHTLENHLVIIGYGVNGTNLSKAARHSGIPYLVIELDAEAVRNEKAKGTPIIFGDASQEHILEMAEVQKARAIVIAISSPQTTKVIVKKIREISQTVFLVVRTRYVREVNDLFALGADYVIPEEFETSIQIFTRILDKFFVPEGDIEAIAERIRSENYELFKGDKNLPKTFKPANFPDFNITCLRVNRDSGSIIGKPLKELHLRKNFGINILGITRNDEFKQNIHPDDQIIHQDTLFINGKTQDIERFRKALN